MQGADQAWNQYRHRKMKLYCQTADGVTVSLGLDWTNRHLNVLSDYSKADCFLKMVAQGQNGLMAFLSKDEYLAYHTRILNKKTEFDRSRFTLVKSPWGHVRNAFYLRRQDPYDSEIKLTIEYIWASGIASLFGVAEPLDMQHLQVNPNSRCKFNTFILILLNKNLVLYIVESILLRKIQLKDMKAPFLFWFIMVIVALIAFVYEKYTYKCLRCRYIKIIKPSQWQLCAFLILLGYALVVTIIFKPNQDGLVLIIESQGDSNIYAQSIISPNKSCYLNLLDVIRVFCTSGG